VHAVARGTEFARDDVVEHGFEVVEEDGVGSAFENEGEAPVGVDAAASGELGGADNDVGKEEGNGEEHAEQHDTEARVDAHQGPELEAVGFLDGVDELPGCEDPPGVAEECFPWTGADVRVGA